MVKKYIRHIVETFAEITHTNASSSLFFNQYITRILFTSLRGFEEDKCRWKSAALTFYTILSIVPAFAVAFGIAKGFGLEENLEKGLKDALIDHPAIANKFIEITYNYIEHAKGGLIGGVGVLLLFFTTIILLKRVEDALNEIWRIRHARSMGRMFTDYLTVVIFCPIFVIASASISVYLVTSIKDITDFQVVAEIIDQLMMLLIHLLPLIISWLLFSLLYYFIPNTKVGFKYALTAGVIAGTLYQIVQWLYISFQVNISSLGAVYGSFAALPLFFIWANLSWMIALFGAEIAYHASVDKDEKQIREFKQTESMQTTLKQLAVFATYRCIRRFRDHAPPLSPSEFATEVCVSIHTASNLFNRLKKAGILVEVATDRTEKCYYPAYATKDITIRDVVLAIDEDRHHKLSVNLSGDLKKIAAKLHELDKDLASSPHNIVLRDIDEQNLELV